MYPTWNEMIRARFVCGSTIMKYPECIFIFSSVFRTIWGKKLPSYWMLYSSFRLFLFSKHTINRTFFLLEQMWQRFSHLTVIVGNDFYGKLKDFVAHYIVDKNTIAQFIWMIWNRYFFACFCNCTLELVTEEKISIIYEYVDLIWNLMLLLKWDALIL